MGRARRLVLVFAAAALTFGLARLSTDRSAVVRADEVRGPHYLNGLVCAALKDPVQQAYRSYRELWRMDTDYSNVRPQPVGAGITVTQKVAGKPVKLTLRDYQRTPDGGANAYTSAGVKRLAAGQVQEAIDDLFGAVREAAGIGYRQRRGLASDVLAVQRRILGENPLGLLERPADPDLQGLTYADVLGLPIITRDSYVPDEIVFGPMVGAAGRALLVSRFGGRQMIFYTPQARVYDCLLGKPIFMLHEMFHANPRMEPAPWAWQWDVELFAALEEQPTPTMADAFFHPYLRAIREIALGFFGYDSRRVWEELVNMPRESTYRFQTVFVNEEKYREHHAKVQEIAQAVTAFVRETLFPEFYADAVFSLGLNRQLCADNAFVEVAAAAHWEVAGLDGLDATQTWLKEHEPQIREAWEEALRNTGQPTPLYERLQKEGGELPADAKDLCPGLGFFIVDRGLPGLSERIDVDAVLADLRKYGRQHVLSKMLEGGYER